LAARRKVSSSRSERVFDQVAPVPDRAVGGGGGVEVRDDAHDRDERGDGVELGGLEVVERHDAAEFLPRRGVGQRAAEQHLLEAEHPGVGPQLRGVESRGLPLGRVESPADSRALEAPVPDSDGVVVEAEAGEHEGMGGHGEHRLHRIPRPHEREQVGEQFRSRAQFADVAVGHDERQGRAAPVPWRAGEYGLQVRCRLGDAGADDRDLMGPQVRKFAAGVEDRIGEHVRLPAEVVAAVNPHGVILRIEQFDDGSQAVRDGLLETREQCGRGRRGNVRRGLRRNPL
jgi:hypothetical protein